MPPPPVGRCVERAGDAGHNGGTAGVLVGADQLGRETGEHELFEQLVQVERGPAAVDDQM